MSLSILLLLWIKVPRALLIAGMDDGRRMLGGLYEISRLWRYIDTDAEKEGFSADA